MGMADIVDDLLFNTTRVSGALLGSSMFVWYAQTDTQEQQEAWQGTFIGTFAELVAEQTSSEEHYPVLMTGAVSVAVHVLR